MTGEITLSEEHAVRHALSAILLLSAFTPALATDMDVSKITCKQFVTAPKEQIATLLTWLEGYYTKDDAPPIMYADKTVKDAKGLRAYCDQHPTDDLITAADAVMEVK